MDFNNREDNNNEPKHSWIASLSPFSYVILVLVIVFFLYQVIGGMMAYLAGAASPDTNVELTRIMLMFGHFMFMLTPTIFLTRLRTPKLKETFRLNAPPPFLLMLSIFGIILIQPALQGYLHLQDFVLNNLPFFNSVFKEFKEAFELIDAATMKIVTSYSSVEFAVVVLVIAVTPAISEEILFRGFVLKNLEKASRPSIAIFLSGFLFAMYHFQPLNFVPLMLLGFFLGFVVYYSNSIFTGMVCHFFNNFFAAFYIFKFGKDEFDTPHIANSETINTAISGVVSLVLFVIILLVYYRFRVKPQISPEEIE
ncbi:MAG: CPBP family intramembrane metalloprotease [Ignavibacteriae bacterium]|nr:MAG: CPBP family intramembrane metalloprotease [Ignavibacteriota bacterium]